MANEELSKRVYVKDLKDILHYKQICGDEESLISRWIIAPDVNRPGFELMGYLESNDLKRVVVLGNKEYDYMCKLDYDTQVSRFEIISDVYTPCIILSEGFKEMDSLIEVCTRKNFPVFKTDDKTYQVIVEVVSYLSEQLAPSTNLYGVMLSIYGKGIMITGKSGIGKSELALDLIKRGHFLVADDRVDASRVHNDIICTAPKLLSKMLEIRGLGIVDITKIFGAQSYLEKMELDFIINLVKLEEVVETDRLNPINNNIDVLGVNIPQLVVPITEGKSLSVIIEAAVSNYILNERGFDSNEAFKQKLRDELKAKNEEIKKQ